MRLLAEVFFSYTLLSPATLKQDIFDISLGMTQEIAAPFRLLYEIGYVKAKSEGEWYDFQRDEIDRRKRSDIVFEMRSLALGGQYLWDSGWQVSGALQYTQVPGQIEVIGQDAATYDFAKSYLCSQFSLGYRWKFGPSRIGFDFLVAPLYLEKTTDMGEAERAGRRGYAPRQEISAAINAVQDLRSLRAGLGMEF